MPPPHSQPENKALKALRSYHRFHGYDYSRGASLFITFAIKGRQPIFGKVQGARVAYSPAGLAMRETIEIENRRNPLLFATKYEVMPDHLHLRLVLKAGCPDGLREIGQFVNNLKRWGRQKSAKLGTNFAWDENYHDRICCSRFINEKVDAYIGYNALKWSLMHGDHALLKVHEGISSTRLPIEEWWSAAGNIDLLSEDRRILAISLSRSLPPPDHPAVLDRLLAAARNGWVLAGTFISPCERKLADVLTINQLPFIKAVPDSLKMTYRPKVEETPLFATGRLLILSRECDPVTSRYHAWHDINDALYAMATRIGSGCGVYVHKKKTQEVQWKRQI